MSNKIRKYQRPFLIGLIVLCMGIMMLGAAVYLKRIQEKLKSDEIQDVMDIILQQRQSFENFVAGDRERLHSYAGHFAELEDMTEQVAHAQLQMIEDADSVYSVLCLEEGWACSNRNACAAGRH